MSDPTPPVDPGHEVVSPDAIEAGGADIEGGGGLDLGALFGGGAGTDEGGGLDLGALLEQASQMQAQMAEAQAQAADAVVEGASGGGVVKISVTGGLEFRSVTIDPGAVDPADVDMLQDLVLAALHDAMAQVQELQAGAMGGLDIGGMDLGGLFGGDGDGGDG